MSELKAYTFSAMERIGLADYYLKSEADKVITELKNEIETQKRLRDMALASVPNALKVAKIIQHNKYKRCLAMARWCETRHFVIRYLQADKILNDENYIGTFDYIRREYMIKHYCRWANKWLALAEEPTWAKFLQLIHKEAK